MNEKCSPIPSEILDKLSKLDDYQLAWLSGYCWSKTKFQKDKDSIQTLSDKEKAVVIISASQTGNAYSVAKIVLDKLVSSGIKSKLIKVSDYKIKDISKEKILLLITSTQGDGEPPEEATLFYKNLYGKKAPDLHNLNFSVLGLGDSSYPNFCQASKDFDDIFAKLGGNRIFNRIDCDLDYEVAVNNWIENIIGILKKEISIKFDNPLDSLSFSNIIDNNNIYDKNNPAVATISVIQRITADDCSKDVKHIEIDLSEQKLSYLPGDSLGVFYSNDDFLVEEILKLHDISDKSEVTLKNGIKENIYNALKYYCDLTKNNSTFVRKYAQLLQDTDLLSIISDNSKLQKFVSETPMIGVLKKSNIISAQQLYDLFISLQPRMYSIASSLDEVENEAHITLSVVEYEYNGKKYTGGASGYLGRRLEEGDKIKVFIQENNNFRLPSDGDAPIIMISSGTGIAPYRAFMQQRQYDNNKGKNWLFFGNQKFIEDFLYQLEWIKYKKNNLLTKYNFAWSRQGLKKEYIQDKILEEGKQVWQWILDGAYIYVCGNASKMAKDVHNVLIKIIQDYGNMDEEKAIDFLDNLYENKRYQRDVY